jgi:hypothetical protein
MWAYKHQDSFESRYLARQTAMTIVVQGFASGPAKYQRIESVYLHAFAIQCTPRCFWTGLQLSLEIDCEPRTKFSMDRTVFANGKSLSYGSEDQVLVAASLFSN